MTHMDDFYDNDHDYYQDDLDEMGNREAWEDSQADARDCGDFDDIFDPEFVDHDPHEYEDDN